jgi:hypothetical protein
MPSLIRLRLLRPCYSGIIRPVIHADNHSHEDIGPSDRSTHRFGAATALVAEDTTGQGHTTLIGDGEPVIQAVIPLADKS